MATAIPTTSVEDCVQSTDTPFEGVRGGGEWVSVDESIIELSCFHWFCVVDQKSSEIKFYIRCGPFAGFYPLSTRKEFKPSSRDGWGRNFITCVPYKLPNWLQLNFFIPHLLYRVLDYGLLEEDRGEVLVNFYSLLCINNAYKLLIVVNVFKVGFQLNYYKSAHMELPLNASLTRSDL